ncbi:MAG: hypothetical protein JWN04_3048, partial [Myxococcaceae bacterium]|nr:hypothetical protein [Myxococcaceae bacterium]
LYDPSFVESFQPNVGDLLYSKNHPELAVLGAKDGQMLSGRAIDNDDPLSRRDHGLEFLDVTSKVRVERIDSPRGRYTGEEVSRLTNISDSVVDTHLLIIVRGLPAGTRLSNASGTTHDGEPYIRVFLPDGVLQPGQQITQGFLFGNGLAQSRQRTPSHCCPGKASRSAKRTSECGKERGRCRLAPE